MPRAPLVSLVPADPERLARRRRVVEEPGVPAVVAPYDRDPGVAAGRAFDRRTGIPIERGRLATHRQVLAQYHLDPEAKFANAGQRLPHERGRGGYGGQGAGSRTTPEGGPA